MHPKWVHNCQPLWKKNYAGHKYAPSLVLIWHHASGCCAPSFTGDYINIVGAAVHCVTVHAGVLCVSHWCSLWWCLLCQHLSCGGAICRAGACHALHQCSGVAFVVLVSVVAWVWVCHAGVAFVWLVFVVGCAGVVLLRTGIHCVGAAFIMWVWHLVAWVWCSSCRCGLRGHALCPKEKRNISIK